MYNYESTGLKSTNSNACFNINTQSKCLLIFINILFNLRILSTNLVVRAEISRVIIKRKGGTVAKILFLGN